MATNHVAPLLPGLPELAPRRARTGRRRCGAQLSHGYAVTHILPPTQDPAYVDFLALWYARVRHDGEHAALWGEVGLSPSQFVMRFLQAPLVLAYDVRQPWVLADGLLMAAWLDDVVPGLRARVHHWVAPPQRHPRVSRELGHALLRVLFDEMGFQALEGRTPVESRGAVRFALRLGFRPTCTLPAGAWTWTPGGTKTSTAVVQTQLTTEEWRAAQTARAEEHDDGVSV